MIDKRFTCNPLEVVFFLIPGFSMMAFSSALEPLRAANRLSRQELFRWQLISADGEPTEASNGVVIIPDGGVDDVDFAPVVAVCASLGAQSFEDRHAFAWLRRLAHRGAIVGGISTGSYILARCGLLENRRCTVHWESLAGFVEDFPELEVTTNLFEIDRDRFTCSGGTAALDLMLDLIAERHGKRLAAAISEQFLHTHIRHADDPQRMELRKRLGVNHPKVLAAIALMENHLEEPLSSADLARSVGLSKRQLERLFRQHLDRTMRQYYMELRLKRAQLLLNQTMMPVLEVAIACGFVSASHFSRSYRAHFGHAPRTERLPAARSDPSGTRFATV